MKTIMHSISLISCFIAISCGKTNYIPEKTTSDDKLCFQVYDRETGKEIPNAEIKYYVNNSYGTWGNYLTTNEKGGVCHTTSEYDEFESLIVTKEGYLDEAYGQMQTVIYLSKPCYYRFKIKSSGEKNNHNLLIIDYKISSQNSHQILLRGKQDTCFIEKAYPGKNTVTWLFDNKKDSMSVTGRTKDTIDVTINY